MKARHVAWMFFLSASAAAAHHNFRSEFDINSPFTINSHMNSRVDHQR